ncbi:MAG: MopE-related protein, partial [Myxococcota bacterium]|nr:MopE-related protein [Myxococcota bacterium]
DELDNDCDGFTDEDATDATTFYADSDGDGYGDADRPYDDCQAPSAYVTDDTDCDDSRYGVNPGATELCVTIYDDDCDDDDNDVDAEGCSAFHLDEDGDGYGVEDSVCLCTGEDTWSSTVDTDCDDGQATVNPGEIESCGTDDDDDCNGETNDEGAAACSYFFYDWDGDGFGIDDSVCTCEATGYYVEDDSDDCDDEDGAV